MNKNNDAKCLGQKLNAIAVASANILADNFTAQELEILYAFFTVLSDALTTIIVVNDCSSTNQIEISQNRKQQRNINME
ncbi:MAG: hypothetical protein GX896_01745 [Clostridiales bacterium]|nr:hypothetical protein [Clostridiales bacterium]